ncbi:MAG: DUF169 domain-containing protein [Candidatus Baldrarchaeia archaeon]
MRLRTHPVAIKLFEKREDALKGYFINNDVNVCQLVAKARYHHLISCLPREQYVCVLGSSCLGFIKTPERLKSGKLNVKFYAKTLEAARRYQENVTKLGDHGHRYDAAMIAPLDITPRDPQIIIIYCTPAQAVRLIHAYAYQDGTATEIKTVAEAALCSAIANIILGKDFVIDFPCAGDRRYGFVQDSELIVAFNPNIIDDLLNGLAETHKAGASRYPFAPFLEWSPKPRSGFETTKEDLEA